MKHCPECNFTFPDLHRVCDFDGTELVSAPEPQALIRVNASHGPSRPRRSLKTSMMLTSLAVLALFLSAVLIGYLDSRAPSIPVVREQPSPALPVSAAPGATAKEQSPAQINSPAPSRRASIASLKRLPKSGSAGPRQRATTSQTLARLRQRTSVENRSRKSEVARREDVQHPRVRTASGSDRIAKSEPKLTAILKTTWKVLKKPFDF